MVSFETISKDSDDAKKIKVGMSSDGSMEICPIDKKMREKTKNKEWSCW